MDEHGESAADGVLRLKLVRKAAAGAMAIASGAILWTAYGSSDRMASRAPETGVALRQCHVDGVKEELRCGVYSVFENRDTRKGRTLPLKIILIPARHPHPQDGPIFYMAGGPGEAATELAELIVEYGDNEDHDVILIDERGSGEGHRLDCPSPVSNDDLEGALNGPFDPAAARACKDELGRKFDLTQYSTSNFLDDVDEVRGAMGYEKINLSAGSFGTYAAMMYMHRYPDRVRTAYLSSLVPLANRVPLYHAEAAQLALEEIFRECGEEAQCAAAYPRLRENFAALMAKLHEAPVLTSARHPTTGRRTEIHLTERAFGDALRVMMYRSPSAREIPFLIEQAMKGDFTPFAEAAVRASRGIYAGSGMGLHYAITCNEFVSRIRPQDVEPATRGMFLGAWRVKDQMAACSEWPKTVVPAEWFEPLRVDQPAVLVSGEADSTGPRGKWGNEVASFMRNATHIVVRGGGHTPENECTRELRHELFRTGATPALNASCIERAKALPFRLPAAGTPGQ